MSSLHPARHSAFSLFAGAFLGICGHLLAGSAAASSLDNNSALHLPNRPPSAAAARHASDRRSGVHFHSSASIAADSLIRAKPGPWGDLEYYTVYLEATTAQLKSTELQTYDTEWNFVGYTEDQVTKLFQSTAMPEPIRTELLDRTKWRHRDKMITVVPSSEALLGITPEARVAIYSVLTQWEEDTYHHEPVLISAHSVREWLEHEDLPDDVVAAVEKTSYHRGKNLVFADIPLVLRMVQTEDERLKIRKALTRTPTLVVSLHVTPETDVTAVAEYWGSATPSKDMLPFLESIVDSGVPRSVDINHLLPPLPRRLLYTFPNPEFGRTGYYPDCHWSALNFRNPDPLDRLADPPLATAYVRQN